MLQYKSPGRDCQTLKILLDNFLLMCYIDLEADLNLLLK